MTEQTQPTDAEIEQLYQEETGFSLKESPAALLDFARTVLAKWGTPAGAGKPDEQMIAEHGIKASRMMARDLTRFDAACEVDKYLREQGAPGYYRHRMSIILFGNVEGTEASRAPDTSAPQPNQAQAGAVPLTEARILELAGLAPDRKVCASTCMTAKFEKKPCECYPTSASRSEVVDIARAIEAAHGIKGADHA